MDISHLSYGVYPDQPKVIVKMEQVSNPANELPVRICLIRYPLKSDSDKSSIQLF